jgi:hypothetical protein
LRLAALLVTAAVVGGCVGSEPPPAVEIAGVRLVPVPPAVRGECQQAADALGYAVLCPTRLPQGAHATPAPSVDTGCTLHAVGIGCFRWRRWLVGTIDFPSPHRAGHVAVQGSPSPLSSRRFVYGPAWWPGSRVAITGSATLRGREASWLSVPEGSESLMGGHLVLTWTEGGHTYGIGFHGHDRAARELGLAVARSATMVYPA